MADFQRILYVDDEPDIRTVATLALETIGGYEVHACESGAAALKQATAFKPDLILLDVMMPGMDGPATLKALQADPEQAQIPVVFFTAKTQREEIDQLRELGAIAVMAKPFDPMTLSDELQTAWKDHQRDA